MKKKLKRKAKAVRKPKRVSKYDSILAAIEEIKDDVARIQWRQRQILEDLESYKRIPDQLSHIERVQRVMFGRQPTNGV